jgi:broad specificity phosphatase PhoE
MTHVLLLRHAQSTWNAQGRWQGWSDAPLSALGEQQASAAGRALASAAFRPDLVVSSDLQRAVRTAELMAGELGYEGPLELDPGLREQDLGFWNGLTNPEIASRWPSELAARGAGTLGTVPGGEDGEHFAERSLRAVERLGAQGASEVLAVTHGGVVIAVERALGVWQPGRGHPNLSGWWLVARGRPPDLELAAVAPFRLPEAEELAEPARPTA